MQRIQAGLTGSDSVMCPSFLKVCTVRANNMWHPLEIRRAHLALENGVCLLVFEKKCSFFFRCDRRNDCGDASDERGCIYEPCQQHQFTCQNGRCIAKAYICDGDNDCGDESDELEHLCSTPEATCSPHHFKCDNGNCIEMAKVCNRLDDCLDNSDEKGCGMFRFIWTILICLKCIGRFNRKMILR